MAVISLVLEPVAAKEVVDDAVATAKRAAAEAVKADEEAEETESAEAGETAVAAEGAAVEAGKADEEAEETESAEAEDAPAEEADAEEAPAHKHAYPCSGSGCGLLSVPGFVARIFPVRVADRKSVV